MQFPRYNPDEDYRCPRKTTDEDYEALIDEHLARTPTRLELQYTCKYPNVSTRGVVVTNSVEQAVSVSWKNPQPLVLSWSLPQEARAALAMLSGGGIDVEWLSSPDAPWHDDELRDLWDKGGQEPKFIGQVDESDGTIAQVWSEDGSIITDWNEIRPRGYDYFSAGPAGISRCTLYFENGPSVNRVFRGFNSSEWNDRFFEDLLTALF